VPIEFRGPVSAGELARQGPLQHASAEKDVIQRQNNDCADCRATCAVNALDVESRHPAAVKEVEQPAADNRADYTEQDIDDGAFAVVLTILLVINPSTKPRRSHTIIDIEGTPSRIGELGSWSNSAMPQKQIKDQDDEQNTAYADAATVAVTRIAETASEQQQKHDDYQDQIHWFPQVAGGGHARPMKTPEVRSSGRSLYSLRLHSAPSVRCTVWHAMQSFGLPE